MKNCQKSGWSVLIFLMLIFTLNGDELKNGEKLFEQQDYKKAGEVLYKLVEAEPENSKALFLLGKIMLQKGETDESIAFFEKAIEIEQKNSEYHLYLAKSCMKALPAANFMRKGFLSNKMKGSLLKSVEYNDNNIEARYSLAMYYMQAPFFAGGDTDKAFAQAEEVVKRVPSVGYKLKGQLFEIDGKTKEAVAAYQKLIEINPADTESYYLIGMAYQNGKDYDNALLYFQKAIGLDGDNATKSLYQIGRTAVFAGRNYDEGAEALKLYLKQKVQSGTPTHDAAHWRLGMIYQKQQKNQLALAEFQKAVEMNPEDENYRKALVEIKKTINKL